MREDDFEVYLRNTNLSENTIASYKFAVKQYFGQFDTVTQKKLRDHKMWLIESYKPKTVNLRIRAINCYLDSIGKGEWKLQFVKVQQKAFLENVISEADYEYFKSCLKRDGELFWYFAVRFMAATGVRVSELIQIKAEHVQIGYMDLYSKGGKLRRIYIPKLLQEEAVAYPHSFRHRFAKSFLERFNDLALLADLMGHESIETTRIYLRRTSTEQQAIVDRVVDW